MMPELNSIPAAKLADVTLSLRDCLLRLKQRRQLQPLLREAAIDPNVTTIKITCYRLAENSKIINTLVNAVRNGKNVTVMLELRARFDEEANLEWKERLEDEGVKVLLGVPNTKVHAKINCMSCHQPHASAQPDLLVKDQANDLAFCVTCHKDLTKR